MAGRRTVAGREQQRTRAFILGCIMFNLIVAFYAGRRSHGASIDAYSYEEVINAAKQCGPGEFIGGCSGCGECAAHEYHAGGCSYFKDKFCTLCEKIKHCPVKQHRCTTNSDQECLECEPGYWDADCKPCHVCKAGEWETRKCTHEHNTKCESCTKCEHNEFTAKACSYFTDTKCKKCHHCVPSIDGFTTERCQTAKEAKLEFPESVYTVGQNTVCAPCSQPFHDGPGGEEGDQLVVMTCSEFADTELKECHTCPCEIRPTCEYETSFCVAGSYLVGGAHDTKCEDCTKIRGGGKTDAEFQPGMEWEVFRCGGTSDAIFKPCSKCMGGEYELAACTQTSDTVCPKCNINLEYGQLQYCQDEALFCTDPQDTKCDECADQWFGETCCYHQYFGSCGTMTTRERIPRRLGYHGETNDEFIEYCVMICDELPDCMAFEVKDAGTTLTESGPNSFGGKTAGCYFKASFTQDDAGGIGDASTEEGQRIESGNGLRGRNHRYRGEDPQWDCYSNVCRQNQQNAKAYDPTVEVGDSYLDAILLEGTAYQAGSLTQ